MCEFSNESDRSSSDTLGKRAKYSCEVVSVFGASGSNDGDGVLNPPRVDDSEAILRLVLMPSVEDEVVEESLVP